MNNDELYSDESLTSQKKYTFKDYKVLKSFSKYLRPYLVSFLLILFLDVFVNLAFTLDPLLFSYIIDCLVAFQNGTLLQSGYRLLSDSLCLRRDGQHGSSDPSVPMPSISAYARPARKSSGISGRPCSSMSSP
jgi:hypothetical protein